MKKHKTVLAKYKLPGDKKKSSSHFGDKPELQYMNNIQFSPPTNRGENFNISIFGQLQMHRRGFQWRLER